MDWLSLDHIQLAIPKGSEDICREFYGALLEWDEVEKPKALAGRGGLWFETKTFRVHLGVDPNFVPAQKAHPAFLMSDLSPLSEKLILANVQVKWDDDLEGYRRFYANDAVGNRIEFMEKTVR